MHAHVAKTAASEWSRSHPAIGKPSMVIVAPMVVGSRFQAGFPCCGSLSKHLIGLDSDSFARSASYEFRTNPRRARTFDARLRPAKQQRTLTHQCAIIPISSRKTSSGMR